MRVLLLHPDFPESFWSFRAVLELVGKRALNPPLGLITVAAMLPADWDLRLVDCAVRPPAEADWTFAEVVFISGMIVQKPSIMALMAEARRRGIPVVAGGPYATSVPQDFEEGGADVLVLDEAEVTLAPFLAHVAGQGLQRRAAGMAALRFDAKGEKPDITVTPVPRFDLLDLQAYDAMAIQYSRGCPFLCEFCDIITLYGRRPRTKSTAQVLAELDALLALGWRGGIFLVDDNFIGNKPNVKKLLPELEAWQAARGTPFWFDTEASIDLASDMDLVASMVRCNFASVFIGIETPDEDSLELTRKHQNNRMPMLESIDLITRAGLRVICGMILGFDNEKPGAGDRIVDFVERADISTAVVSMLQVLPNTGLYTRLAKEGRLTDGLTGIGQTDLTNFIPTRPAEDIAQEYVEAYRKLYEPSAYLDRTARQFLRLGLNPPFDLQAPAPATIALSRTPAQRRTDRAHVWRIARAFAIVTWRQGVVRSSRWRFWANLWRVGRANPSRLATYLAICAQAEHFIPLTDMLTRALEARIAALPADRRGLTALHAAPAPTPKRARAAT